MLKYSTAILTNVHKTKEMLEMARIWAQLYSHRTKDLPMASSSGTSGTALSAIYSAVLNGFRFKHVLPEIFKLKFNFFNFKI